MRTTAICLVLAIASANTWAQSSAATLETTAADVGMAKSENPWKIGYNLEFNTNVDTGYNWNAIAPGSVSIKDTFLNKVSASNSFEIWAAGKAKLTYTPKMGASFFTEQPDAKAANNTVEADQLKTANINNELAYTTEVGNVSYLAKMNADYFNGYQWIDGETDAFDYKRTLDNLSVGTTLGATIAVTKSYVIANAVSVKRTSFTHPRYTYATSDSLKYGEQNGANEYSAVINNKLILSDAVALEFPFAYSRKDYINRHPYANVDFSDRVPGETRLLDIWTVGAKATVTLGMVNVSGGVNTGRMEDRRNAVGEDADYVKMETSAAVDISDKVAIGATWDFEGFYYDGINSDGTAYKEAYQNYGAALTLKQPIKNLDMDAEIAHKIAVGREDYIGFDNEATSLNLNFKL